MKKMYCIFQVLKDTLTQLFSYALYLFRYEHYVDNQTHSSTHSAQWGLFSSAVWVHKCCHWNMSTALWIAMDSANLSLAAAALAAGCFQVWQQHDLFDLHRAAGWLQTSSPLTRIRMRRVSCLFLFFEGTLKQWIITGFISLYAARASSLSAISNTSVSDILASYSKAHQFWTKADVAASVYISSVVPDGLPLSVTGGVSTCWRTVLRKKK